MKTWVKCSIFGLFIGAAIGLVFWLTSCTAPVQIHVRTDQEQYQCPADVVNHDGTVNLNNCQKSDGDSPSDQDATDGKDSLEVSLVPFAPNPN